MEIEIIKITPKAEAIQMAEYLTNFLSKIKILHWYTLNYNLHKILNDVYDNLSEHFDSLQEEIIGTSKINSISFPNLDLSNSQTLNSNYNFLSSDKSIIDFYDTLTKEIKNILCGNEFNSYVSNNQTGLNNIKEEILSEINKSLYLISMINI
jgi:DNA-binding ferritin-like protein